MGPAAALHRGPADGCPKSSHHVVRGRSRSEAVKTWPSDGWRGSPCLREGSPRSAGEFRARAGCGVRGGDREEENERYSAKLFLFIGFPNSIKMDATGT